jgi:hypothetical protein
VPTQFKLTVAQSTFSRSLRLQYNKALVTPGKALYIRSGTRVLSFHSLVDVHGALATLRSRPSSSKALKLQCTAALLAPGRTVLSFHSLVDVHGALAALWSRSSSSKALKLQCRTRLCKAGVL